MKIGFKITNKFIFSCIQEYLIVNVFKNNLKNEYNFFKYFKRIGNVKFLKLIYGYPLDKILFIALNLWTTIV